MKKILYLTIMFSLIIMASCTQIKKEANLTEQTNDKLDSIINDTDTANLAEETTAKTATTTQTTCDDSCKKDKAIAGKDYVICSEIKSVGIKNNCLYNVGINTKNQDACTKISDLTLRNKCYNQIGYTPPKEEVDLKNTYTKTGDTVCTQNGVPIVRLYGASYCPHCRWVGKTFYTVAKEYADKGLIQAYYWELNGGQNLMDEIATNFMNQEEIDFYNTHDSKGAIPYFNIGCIYERFGNGYEGEDQGLEKEEAELRTRIDDAIAKLIKQ